ncbi:uncharacterized protein LOC110760406 [Prunus avium]|uniref:Uncharacterized protein LOC110760406 n=1 Tax=Prunus avium TaxID=42229 RepID=A0A6P5SXI0_PRUAV|nr:uncharacterized protein LOC110760406 [Prunus avium]
MGDPSEGAAEIEDDRAEANSSRVSWIMNKGLGLGKKILVTGIVISSAPLVLPPLVVISAIGFAFCVPCAVVLASYACIVKLMNKLLPYSTPPVLLENGTLMSNDDEEEEEQGEEQSTWVGGKIDTEKEEGWGSGDILEGGEMRIELVEEENEEIFEEGRIEEGDECVQEGVKKNAQEYFAEDENRYEEDVGEATDVEEMLIFDNINVVNIEGLIQDYKDDTLLDENSVSDMYGLVSNVVEGAEEIGLTPIEVTAVVMEESGYQETASNTAEEEELVEETRELLEKIRDEGNADNAMDMEKQYAGEVEGAKWEVRDQQFDWNAEEREILVEDKISDIGLEKPTGTMNGGVGRVPNECEDMQERQEMKHVNDANTTTVSGHVKPTGDIGSVLESKNADNNLEAEKPIGEANDVGNTSEAETRNLRPVMSSVVEDKQKPEISKEEIVLQRGRAEDNVNNLDFQLIREKETVVSSNADAREIADESGLHLFDEKNVSGQQYTSYETSKGHGVDEGADFAELPVSHRAHESTDAVISSGKDVSMHPNGVLYNEAKIWRQIDAMRRIVGYKATPHATCIEELKALYLFTGVEPPASFGDHPDLAQVNDKLRFLMSIIGVKLD